MIHTPAYEFAKIYNTVKSEMKYRFIDYAVSNNFPVIHEDALQFLMWFNRLTKPKTILELGTGFGFMAYHLLKSNSELKLTGVDYTSENYDVFLSMKPEAEIINRYHFHEGNVMFWLPPHEEKYDWIIIDCDKKYYPPLIEHGMKNLNSGGFLIADNVLWKGMVAEAEKQSKVEPILIFNRMIANNPNLDSVIIPVGDGLSLSRKIT